MKLVWSPEKASKAYLDTVKSVSLTISDFVLLNSEFRVDEF